jgi:nucleoside-diphosphate-sugar epimerase
MAHVLVTGSTGFIGRNLVERLVARGDAVRCLIRKPTQHGFLGSLRVEYIGGNILAPESLALALQGVEVVYHLAGATEVVSPREYALGNITGNCNIAQACAGVSRPPTVVYVSSLAAAGPALAGRPLRESDPPAPVSEYGRTKLQGEHRFRAVADRVAVTVVRPPSVFGPWDFHTLRLFRAVRWRINCVPGGRDIRLSWVYVGDLVAALILAAERGARLRPVEQGPDDEQGIYYAALDEQPTLAEVGRLAASALQMQLWHTFYVPGPILRLFARVNTLRAWITRRPILLSSDKIQEGLAGSWLCAADKAKQELGFTCRMGLVEGFERTAAWYRANGLL